ncbi:MAG: TVP38/TMEM64 family protein [Clostridia bacterium]|nr:TVP38/TMEM64 family protein [Clostridia bacterium]
MKENKIKVSKTADILRKGIPVFFWAAVILLCFLYRDRITVENIVNFTPENPVLAVGIMLLLFAFKSVTFVIYGSILYAVNGILFPLPFAILLNMAGSAIMATLPFLIGRRKGSGLLVKLTEKYPKLSVLRKLPSENGFFLSMVIRLMGYLPGDVVSMYFGASGIRYREYLTGTLIGLTPSIVIFTVMGMSADDVTSPAFIISVCCEILTALTSIIWFFCWNRKRRKSL